MLRALDFRCGAMVGVFCVLGWVWAGEPPDPPVEKDLKIYHQVGVADKDDSFKEVVSGAPHAHVITTPVAPITLIPPASIKTGSYWPKTTWVMIEDVATKNWVRTSNPEGHRVHLLVVGKYGAKGEGGGKGETVWSTLSVDLDLDADTDRNGLANFTDLDADLKEDPNEDTERNLGAVVIARPQEPAPLLLRQVLPDKPRPRPDGSVHIKQEGTERVRITERDGTVVTGQTNLWDKVKGAELPLRMEAAADAQNAPQVGPCTLTATYTASSGPTFTDKVKVMVMDIEPQVYGHAKDAQPAPQVLTTDFKWGENRFLFSR